MYYTPVAVLAVFALLAAILGLVPNTLYAQEVVHAFLSAITGAAILHLLVLASSPRFKLYAYFVLPIILLSCATLLGVITPFTSIKSHIPSVLFLIFTLSTLPHTVFLLLHIQPSLSIPPLSLSLPPPLPSPTSSASSFPSSQSHEKPHITGTFADYKSSILPPPPALLFTEHPTSSWFSQSDVDVESLTDHPSRSSANGSLLVLLQIPTLVLAAQLCSVLASAFEIPAVVLASNPETGVLSLNFVSEQAQSTTAALESTFQILQATFTMFCLILVLVAYYRRSLDTHPAGMDVHKPTPTPPPTPASDLSSSGSRSRSRSNSTNTYRNQSQSRSRSRETLTPTPRLVFPLRTSTPVPTPKSKSNSRFATPSSDSINTIPIPVSIPVHTYVQHAYTHTRFQHSSASSFSSPRPKRTPLKVCTSFSSLTNAGRERDVLVPSPMATTTTLGCCMRTGTGPGASVGAGTNTSHKSTPSTSTSISITTGSNYSHNTPSDELDVVDADRDGDGNRVDAYAHSATSGNSTGGIQATPTVSVRALDQAFRYKDTRPHGYTPARPATPTASRRLNMGAYTVNNNLNKTKTARPSPGLQNARTHPHPHSYPDYSHSHSRTTQTHISSSNSDSPHSQEQDHDHDFTDLRDPFAPRVSSFAHLVSPHYILRASLPTHPHPHPHSDPSAPSHVQPTRMSAWGRLQFPVRLPLPGPNAGANSNASTNTATCTGLGLVMPVGVAHGSTTAVLPISGPWGITTEGHGGRVKSGKAVTGKTRSKIGRGSKERLGRHGVGREKVKERERVLEDIDMEDSALLAQRLLRRLQRQGAGGGG